MQRDIFATIRVLRISRKFLTDELKLVYCNLENLTNPQVNMYQLYFHFMVKKSYFAEEIKKLFRQQNYQVVGLFDRSKNEILDTVHDLASKKYSAKFICFLSSHGNATSLVCRREHGEDKVKIKDIFKSADTPQLKDCPKIFFIDACRSCKYYHYTYLLCGIA